MSMSSGKTYNVFIIGTGKEGHAIAKLLTKHGCKVHLMNDKDKEACEDLAKQTGATVVELKAESLKDAEIIFLCIPLKAVAQLPKDLFSACRSEVIVVDCCNYYPSRDGQIQEIDDGTPESVWTKEQIGRDVIKAFNAVLAGVLEKAGRPHGSENRLAIPISGDNPGQKEKISKLIDEVGFDPLDAGNLSDSWRLQPGSPGYCTSLDSARLSKAIMHANREAMPILRDEAYKKMTSASQSMDTDTLVRTLRETYADASRQISLDDLMGTSQQVKSS